MSKKIQDHKARWKRISEAMEVAGIRSQRHLARRLDISSPAVSGWAKGHHQPTLDKMEILAGWAGFSTEWLLTGRGDKIPGKSLTVDELKMLQNYRRCNDAKKLQAQQYIDFLLSD